MTKKELEDIYQFLAAYWYDREEDDMSIVNEFVRDVTSERLEYQVRLLKQFTDSIDSKQFTSDFIRRAAWRYFPPEIDAPINWLKGIILLLEEASIAPNQ